MKKRKQVISLFLVMIMLVVCVPFSASAADTTVPVVTYPTQYQEVYPNTSLTIRWNAPSTGTVSSYCISVRELARNGTVVSNLIRNKVIVSSSTRTMTLSASEMKSNGAYRISVSANMSDGTIRWASLINCHTAFGKPIASGKTISFKIYRNFSTAFKDAIYYSTRTWIDVMSQEKVNTYSYDQGTYNLDCDPTDSENTVVPYSGGTSAAVMSTYVAYDANGRIIKADILINTSFSFSTNLATGTFDVQNVMTHEVGHVLCLSDKYETYAQNWTMYGYVEPGQTIFRSLTNQDIAAINDMYP